MVEQDHEQDVVLIPVIGPQVANSNDIMHSILASTPQLTELDVKSALQNRISTINVLEVARQMSEESGLSLSELDIANRLNEIGLAAQYLAVNVTGHRKMPRNDPRLRELDADIRVNEAKVTSVVVSQPRYEFPGQPKGPQIGPSRPDLSPPSKPSSSPSSISRSDVIGVLVDTVKDMTKDPKTSAPIQSTAIGVLLTPETTADQEFWHPSIDQDTGQPSYKDDDKDDLDPSPKELDEKESKGEADEADEADEDDKDDDANPDDSDTTELDSSEEQAKQVEAEAKEKTKVTGRYIDPDTGEPVDDPSLFPEFDPFRLSVEDLFDPERIGADEPDSDESSDSHLDQDSADPPPPDESEILLAHAIAAALIVGNPDAPGCGSVPIDFSGLGGEGAFPLHLSVIGKPNSTPSIGASLTS